MAKKTLKQIERILKSDIKWAIEKGPGWDSNRGACLEGGVFKRRIRNEWQLTQFVEKPCGVCAIGAFCVRRQPKIEAGPVELKDDVQAASRVFGKPYAWVNDLYQAVADVNSVSQDRIAGFIKREVAIGGRSRSALKMANSLCRYAEKVQARHAA